MEDMTRRSFVGAAAAMGVVAATGMTAAGEASAAPIVVEECHPGDLSDLEMQRNLDVSFAELTAARRAVIDACEDFVRSDGTVVPAAFVKVRATVDGLGFGVGHCNAEPLDTTFDYWMTLCNNDEFLAEVYSGSPIGVRFTALDSAVATGYTEAECAEALKALAYNGLLMHIEVCGVDYYQHQRIAHGIIESSMNLYDIEGFCDSRGPALVGSDSSPFPWYYPIPLNADIVAEKTIYAFDDIEGLLQRHEIFAVAPCQCHYLKRSLTGEELPEIHDREAIQNWIADDGNHLEKCVVFGEEAQFYLEQGIAREITRDEAREILQRSYEEGCVLDSGYTKYTEVICSCSGTQCGVLAGFKAMDRTLPGYANISHYLLTYDQELCLKCGACANRCPLEAIAMNDEGYPEVVSNCCRCGQCCYICPAEARKLTLKPEEQIPELPADMLEWMNVDTMYRMEKGMWPKFDA